MITKAAQTALLDSIINQIRLSGQPADAVEIKIRVYRADKKKISIIIGKDIKPISSLVISESALQIEPPLPQYVADEMLKSAGVLVPQAEDVPLLSPEADRPPVKH